MILIGWSSNQWHFFPSLNWNLVYICKHTANLLPDCLLQYRSVWSYTWYLAVSGLQISIGHQTITNRNKCLTDMKLFQSDIVSERKIKTYEVFIKCKRLRVHLSMKKNIFFILKKFSHHWFIYIACYNKLNIINLNILNNKSFFWKWNF